MSAKSTNNVRAFQMHTNLLRDLIERQAGTLDKAVLEDVMNLIEAKATRGDITLKRKLLIIKDDGKGFEDRQEIIDAFETFGKSDERKAQEKKWARFQIGRGQLFAFAKTTYRTRTFKMTVDIRDEKLGCGYQLEEGLPDEPGCTITAELYETLDPAALVSIPRAIAENVRFVEIPIYVNGKLVNAPPQSEKWSLEDDDGYYRFNESAHTLQIYNLGVFVRTISSPGIGGVVVSKRQLDVNFARNDVLSSCPVYRRIIKHFRARGEKSLLERKSFSAEQALDVIGSFRNGIYSKSQVAPLRLFRTTLGKAVSAYEILRSEKLSASTPDDDLADKAMAQDKKLIVLSLPHLSAIFGSAEPKQLITVLLKFAKDVVEYNQEPPSYVPIETLHEGVHLDTEIIPKAKYSKIEVIALGVLNRAFFNGLFERGSEYKHHQNHRDIILGKMQGWEAWTNGVSYIAIERNTLKRLMRNLNGWTELMLLLAHEFAHTSDERTHDADFYERYHEYSNFAIQETAFCFRNFSRSCYKAGLPLRDLQNVRALELVEGDFIEADYEERHHGTASPPAESLPVAADTDGDPIPNATPKTPRRLQQTNSATPLQTSLFAP